MRASAGILLYRDHDGTREFLIAHPGGPYWAHKDEGAWSLPKGEIEAGEEPVGAAIREFAEEVGPVLAREKMISLATIRQRSRKIVHGFGCAGNFDPNALDSNRIQVEWPPASGRFRWIPEIDEVRWVDHTEARRLLNPAQMPFLDRLSAAVDYR